jgi:outer membrane protein
MRKIGVAATFLMIGVFCCYLDDSSADNVSGIRLAANEGKPALSRSSPQGSEDINVSASLQRMAREVVRRNASVFNDYLQAQMSREQITAEKGIFEPVFETSYNKQKVHVPNSTEDILIRQQLEYTEKSDAVNIGLSGLIPTGAQWSIQFLDNEKSSSLIEQYRTYMTEYNNTLKLSLEQPLLRGFGFDATMAKVNLAKVQGEIDENKFEQKLMELVGVTIQLYWKLYGAQQIAQSWETSLKIAEDSLTDIEMRAAGGKIAGTEVLEAQSSVNARRSELLGARSKAVEAQNQLMTLLNVSASENKGIRLIPKDNPFGDYAEILSTDEYVRLALERWPEYKIAKKAVEKERIQVKAARDQLLPKLNLVGSVSTAGLNSDRSGSMKDVGDDKFLSWSVGVKLNIPIFGNMQSKSGLSIAKMRARQAENELEAFVKSLNNSIHSKVEALQSFKGQLLEYEKGLKVMDRLLEAERIKFKSGRTNLKGLFAKEEDYINYQRKVLSAVVNYRIAEASLEIAMGNILAKYGIDKQDIHHRTADLSGGVREMLE